MKEGTERVFLATRRLISARLADKQVQGDEIPKEHSNHLGHNIQHILDAYNSAHETPHAPIFVRLSVLRSNHTQLHE